MPASRKIIFTPMPHNQSVQSYTPVELDLFTEEIYTGLYLSPYKAWIYRLTHYIFHFLCFMFVARATLL